MDVSLCIELVALFNFIKENWDNLNLFFLSKVEYNDQLKTQTNIHISPLLKLKEIIFCISALEIIVPTPIIDKINPDNWNMLVFSIFIIDEKIIIMGGIAANIKTAFITWVKFKAKYTTELKVLIESIPMKPITKKFSFI